MSSQNRNQRRQTRMEVQNQQPNQQTPPPSEPLTLDAVRGMLAENDAKWQARMDAQQNDLSAQSRGAKKSKSPVTSEAVQLQQEWEQKQSDKAINLSLATSMEALGTINPANVSKYFKSNYGDRIKVDDDGTVQFSES